MAYGWLLVWFGGLALAHLVVLAVVLRGWSFGSGQAAGEGDADTVVCPECGTENEPAYRYCRACVSTLGGAARDGSGDRPGSRRVP